LPRQRHKKTEKNWPVSLPNGNSFPERNHNAKTVATNAQVVNTVYVWNGVQHPVYSTSNPEDAKDVADAWRIEYYDVWIEPDPDKTY